MIGSLPACCARAASGQVMAMPPRIKSRRRIAFPRLRTTPMSAFTQRIKSGNCGQRNGFDRHLAQQQFQGLYVSLGSKGDVTLLNFDVRFTPESGL
jgi:hypothetical protein